MNSQFKIITHRQELAGLQKRSSSFDPIWKATIRDSFASKKTVVDPNRDWIFSNRNWPNGGCEHLCKSISVAFKVQAGSFPIQVKRRWPSLCSGFFYRSKWIGMLRIGGAVGLLYSWKAVLAKRRRPQTESESGFLPVSSIFNSNISFHSVLVLS